MKRQLITALCGCVGLQLVPATVRAESESIVDYESKYNELLDNYNELMEKYNDLLKTIEEEAESELPDDDILFKDIPWETSFADAQVLAPELNLDTYFDPDLSVLSVDDIIYGGITGTDFDSTGLMLSAFALNPQQSIFGYTTSSVYAYFAFPSSNGTIDYTNENAVLYGATYEFNTDNTDEMVDSLRSSLSDAYGDPLKDYDEDSVSQKNGMVSFNLYNGHFVVWETKTSILSIHSCDYGKDSPVPSTVQINYAWKDADDMLHKNDKLISNQ